MSGRIEAFRRNAFCLEMPPSPTCAVHQSRQLSKVLGRAGRTATIPVFGPKAAESDVHASSRKSSGADESRLAADRQPTSPIRQVVNDEHPRDEELALAGIVSAPRENTQES
jgi:hypothetical protein